MKALLVEDDPATARFVAAVLERAGHEARICPSAEEAHDLLIREGAWAWPLCVVDLALPGHDGIWLCRWIRSQTGGAKPYLLVGTGSGYREKLAEAFEAGADDYVEKPYDAQALRLRVAVAAQHVAMRAEQSRLAAALDREQGMVSAMFDAAAACIVALDPGQRVTLANAATGGLTGREAGSLRHAGFADLFPDTGGRGDTIREKLERLTAGATDSCQFETSLALPESSPRELSWTCRRSDPPPGEIDPLVVCVGTDITERRRLESQLAFLAERDPLTHLYNRARLDPALQEALDAAGEGRPAALLCIDLDDFKIVNDTAGHAAGDSLLQDAARAIARHARASDSVIRLGGDEFVLVLPDATVDQARAIAERILAAIAGLGFTAEGRAFRVTASAGLAALGPGMTREEALASADAACYASKRGGRNLVSHAAAAGGERASDHAWRTRITDAIARDAAILHLQPVVSLDDGAIHFHEILARLPGAGGFSLPGHFLPPARRFNLLPELDRCIVRQSLSLLSARPDLALSVNLSGRSASDPRLPDFLLAAFRSAGIAPGRIIFEITESELISDLPQAIERLSSLRARGFRFALDDFGHGYSSFRYLRDLPVEMVKLDGSYTRAIAGDQASAAFVRAITDLAHAIGLLCVAEHVEDAASAAALRGLGVDLGQGHHFGRPKGLGSRGEECPACLEVALPA